jgi:streptomycin 6-kinase
MDDVVREMAARWSLTLGASYPSGPIATVVRAESADHGAVALKVARRDYEEEHQAAGLRRWDGDGTVRLHAAVDVDDEHAALLLERCEPGTVLRVRPEPEQDEVVASMLRRLWRPAGAPFRPLADLCDRWADEHEAKVAAHGSPLDDGLRREGIALFRALPASAARHVLLCTDLHAGNIVAAQREPWLVIDPKPFVGDPTYDALQHMLNCTERLTVAPLELVARMADLLELDRERLRLWLFARCVQDSPGWPVLAGFARAVAP